MSARDTSVSCAAYRIAGRARPPRHSLRLRRRGRPSYLPTLPSVPSNPVTGASRPVELPDDAEPDTPPTSDVIGASGLDVPPDPAALPTVPVTVLSKPVTGASGFAPVSYTHL